MHSNRTRNAELAQHTVQILQDGHYRSASGQLVDIAPHLQRAIDGTITYSPDRSLSAPAAVGATLCTTVTNETTMTAAQRLIRAGHRAVALNFASARHPGGGFLNGAQAQEESLCRSSGLYACLAGNPMYEFHNARSDPMYSQYAIYSPDVPVFRSDDGALLADPFLCSFITCPAANAKIVLERSPSRRLAVRQAMAERICRVLTIAAVHGHLSLVLGAWGCGVFGNDASEIAELFRKALAGEFQGAFSQVVFAVLDSSKERRFIEPFERAFR